jgi:hypothetical protein
MSRPWHHRRLRVRPGGRRTSAAVRLRAHEVALGAWEGACKWPAVYSYSVPPRRGHTWKWVVREMVATNWADGWAAAARRWA